MGLKPYAEQAEEKNLASFFGHVSRVSPRDLPPSYARTLLALPAHVAVGWGGGTYTLKMRSPLGKGQLAVLKALSTAITGVDSDDLAGLSRLESIKHDHTVRGRVRDARLEKGMTGMAYAIAKKGAALEAEYTVEKDTDGTDVLVASVVRLPAAPYARVEQLPHLLFERRQLSGGCMRDVKD